MVVENQETILTCEYCGAQTKVLWKEGMIPNCEACGAPLRIDLQDKGQEPVYAAGTGQETTRARRGISPAKIILLIFAVMVVLRIVGNFVRNSYNSQSVSNVQEQTQMQDSIYVEEIGRTCYLDFNKDACRPGSIGRPVPNARFAVMGPDHKPIESNPEHTGLLASAGPMNMSGYWGEPGLTAETVQDGYVMTADMSYIDPDGYVYVLGRADDVINYKGIKISPEEIEEAASGCAMVADCACIPMEDELAGQVPKLFVVPAEGIEYSEAELFAYLKEHIDDNRMPRIIELIDVIPRTYNGKVLRRELAAR